MNLKKINDCIDIYKNIIKDPAYDGWRLWELAQQFQSNWNIDASDFSEMYRLSFAINSPLWHRDNYYPKLALLKYAELYEDLVREMFRDLLNEKKDLSGRIGRFIFQCDQFYKIERQSNKMVLPHDHSDMEMIFIYLSLHDPEKYAVYKFSKFEQFMKRIGSTEIPKPQDLDRFVKVCRTLSVLLQKDEELQNLIHKNVDFITNGKLYPMLAVSELYLSGHS